MFKFQFKILYKNSKINLIINKFSFTKKDVRTKYITEKQSWVELDPNSYKTVLNHIQY